MTKLNPDSVEFYNARGLAYSSKGKFARAIAEYSKAIKLNPRFADAYNNRGLAYMMEDNYGRAITDCGKAMKLQPGYISRSVPCYIISQVGSGKASRLLLKLYRIIYKIQTMLIYKPRQQAANLIAHYTTLASLKESIKRMLFHLHNAADMSDLEEGKIFLNILKETLGDTKIAKAVIAIIKKLYHKQNDKNLLSSAYTGSFVEIQEEEDYENGRLSLWRTYGKDQGREAAGACLHFDISKLSTKPRSELGAMKSHVAVVDHSNPMPASPPENCIYRVVYENEIWGKSERKLKNAFQEIGKTLKDIYIMKTQQPKADQAKIDQVMIEILDEIRFLFKASHYREEKELRMVEIHYPSGNGRSKDADQLDVDSSPPRPYIKASPQLKLKEVILGPQAQRFRGWKWWIEEKNKKSKVKVRQSKIKYKDSSS